MFVYKFPRLSWSFDERRMKIVQMYLISFNKYLQLWFYFLRLLLISIKIAIGRFFSPQGTLISMWNIPCDFLSAEIIYLPY